MTQSIGLGYSRPVEGLMERRPRPPGPPTLSGGSSPGSSRSGW
jgi:hypothetical protein